MKKKPRSWIAAFSPASVLALVGCPVVHGQDVVTDYLSGTHFSKYRAYKSVMMETPHQPDQIPDTQIKRSVDSPLEAKGLTKVDTDEADLLVAYQCALNRETQWNAWAGATASAGLNISRLRWSRRISK